METRSLEGEADSAQIAELVYAHPGQYTHETDLPYRLSSWSVQNPANGRLWQDEDGRLLAFAIMQEPFLTLDYFMHPKVRSMALEQEILDWANGRAPQVAIEQGRTFPYHVFSREVSPEQIALWQAAGLVRAEDMDEMFLIHPLDTPIAHASLPDGFVARPLQGVDEVPAYVTAHQAAFGSTNMRENWRCQMLTHPHYRPELDTVIEAPDGRIAAFGIGWLHPNGQTGCIEPLGVHPDFQRMGLGKAVLREELRLLQLSGAAYVSLFTGADNEAALALYKNEGFYEWFRERGYGRLFYPDKD